MYLWQAINSDDEVIHILTLEPKTEIAQFRAGQKIKMGQSLMSCSLVGYVPGIAGSSSDLNPNVYHVTAQYIYPNDPPDNPFTKRIPTEFMKSIDTKVGDFYGLSVGVSGGPTLNEGIISIVVGLITGNSEEAMEVISAEVFRGLVPPENITIVRISNIKFFKEREARQQ